MAVQLTLTDEQASWLSGYLGERLNDWSWRQPPAPSVDAEEHAQTIKRKLDAGVSAGSWDGPGGR